MQWGNICGDNAKRLTLPVKHVSDFWIYLASQRVYSSKIILCFQLQN